AIIGLTALTVATGIAAYLALVARNDAIAQRDLALCRQLATKSLGQLDQRLDLALLIAVEAGRQYSCPDVSSALLAAVHHQPRLLGFVTMPQTKESVAMG